MSALVEYSPKIKQLYASHKVKTLYVFGSILKEHFKDESDVDLVVDFEVTHPSKSMQIIILI